MKRLSVDSSTGLGLVGAIALSVGASEGLASGFAIPEISVAGLGTSNALVANPEELGALPYNPSAMGFHDYSAVSAGLMLFMPSLEVTTATGNQDSQGDDTIPIPTFQGELKIDGRWSLGLGANAPFGLETVWPLGTFPALSVPLPVAPGVTLPAGLYHPTQSKLELLTIVPAVAYRVSDEFSIAGGVDYYDARKVVFNTALVETRGDGDAWGWHLSALFRRGPLSLGASYHSEVTVEVDGSFTVRDPILAAVGLRSQPAAADLNLPSRLQVGARYAFTDRLAAELDWSRLGWSHLGSIEITSRETGATLSSSRNDWDDTNAYRLGVTYDLSPRTQLRFGYTYDETGQGGDTFSARIPDADRNLFSIGVAHGFGNGWKLEGGYMYVKWDDNDYRADRPFDPRTGDPNGTTALNGEYKAHVHIFGIGVNKSFM